MRQPKTGQLLIISTVAFFATLACLAILIANVSNVELGEGGGSIGPTASQIVPVAVYVLMGIWILVFAIVIVRFFVRGSSSRSAMPRNSSLMTWVALLIVLAALLGLTQITNLQIGSDGQNSTPNPNQQNQTGISAEQNNWSSYAPTVVIVIVLAAIVIVALTLTVRSSRRGGFGGMMVPPPPEAPAESGQFIEAAIDDLKTSDDARGAIIRIYAQMCRLMRGGEERTLTPRELKTIAVAGYGWPEEPVVKLTLIFEEARYSDHRMRDESKDIALSCLDQIKGSLPETKGGAAAAS